MLRRLSYGVAYRRSPRLGRRELPSVFRLPVVPSYAAASLVRANPWVARVHRYIEGAH